MCCVCAISSEVRAKLTLLFSFLTTSRRAPVLTINANGVSPRRRPSRRKRDIGAIAGGLLGGVAAVIGVVVSSYSVDGDGPDPKLSCLLRLIPGKPAHMPVR